MNDKYYSLQEIIRGEMIPVLPTTYLLRRAVKSGVLKAITTSRRSGIRYSVKEEWIDRFNSDFDKGKIKNI